MIRMTADSTLRLIGRFATALLAFGTTAPLAGQATPAAAPVPPDDTPAIRVGATLFADYTIQQQPKIRDADGNEVTSNAFNVGRAYINVTGNISHNIAFRITPDITRETGTGSSLSGSYTFRLKYAYAQFNLDDHLNPGRTGTWVRLGMQQTPWVDFMETVYRYRFQGTIFEDRDGFLSSSDIGLSFRYNLPDNYGDIHSGLYNGDTYTRPEANNQKAFMVRGSLRPLRTHPVLRGLRVTGFYDHDAYVKNAERRRAIGALTFEHKYLNASFDYLAATDQTSVTRSPVDARGFSVWATPRTTVGWEGLIRYDHLEPNTDLSGTRKRAIGGVAYWFPHQGSVSTVLLLDVEQVTFAGFALPQPTQRRIAVHALVNF
jgi:hypothetical protein